MDQLSFLKSLIEKTIRSTDNQVRRETEEQLNAFEETYPGAFATNLLQIISLPDPLLSHTASILFKNKIIRRWSLLPGEEKQPIRDGLLVIIPSLPPATRTQVLLAVSNILSHDHSQGQWPNYYPIVKSRIEEHHGLLCLLALVQTYQWITVGKRQTLHGVIDDLFPHLLNFSCSRWLPTDDYTKLHTILKIYHCSIRLELYTSQMNTMVEWGTLFLQIISKPTPSVSPKDPVWKVKKWALRCIDTLFCRYAKAMKSDDRYKAFSKMFLNDFAPQIVSVYCNLIESGVFLSDRSKQLISSFLEESIKPKVTWVVLKPHLETLITRFIYPLVCFTDGDLYEDDPVEFIHKKVDPPIEDYKCPSTAAEKLLQRIVSDRGKQTLTPILTFIKTVFDSTADPIQLYGAISMMIAISSQLEKNPGFKDQIEGFLCSFVFPQLSSPQGFMRTLGLQAIRAFSDIQFKDGGNIEFVVKSTLSLIQDPDLPVKVAACLTLSPFVRQGHVKDALRGHAVAIMQELLKLTNEIDMDTLTHVMEQLVFEYSGELMPFAVELASQFKDTFIRIMGDPSDDVEEADDRIMAGMGILKTIASLVLAVEASPEIVLNIEVAIAPVFDFVLGQCYLDLYEEIFEIIESCTFAAKQISPTMWRIFPFIYNNFKEDAVDYLEEVLPSLDNYLTYGKEVVSNSPEMIQQFMDIAVTVTTMDDGMVEESDRCKGCQLMEAMMLNLKNIDSCIPTFIQIAYTFLNGKIKTPSFKVHALEIVINAIYYNPTLTLSLLEQANFIQFFNLWFSQLDDFVRVHDKKLSILALISLLSLPLESYSPSLQPLVPQFFMAILKIFESYDEAVEERKREEELHEKVSDDEQEDLEQDLEQELDQDLSDEEEDDDYQKYLSATGKYDSGDFEDWDMDDLLLEDIYFITVLEDIDPKLKFKQLVQVLPQSLTFHLESILTPQQKQQLSVFLQ